RQAMGSWPLSTLPVYPPVIAAASNATLSGLTANWQANGNDASVAYRVQAATEPGYSTIASYADSSAGATSQALNGISSATTYYVRAIALTNGATSFATTSGYSTVTANTVGLWHLDEGSGSSSVDAAGSNNLTAGSFNWNPGIYGQALTFPTNYVQGGAT